MTTSSQIIRDLKAGQSSIRAIAERLHQPEKVLTAYLEDLEISGLVESFLLKDVILVWRLTDRGRAEL